MNRNDFGQMLFLTPSNDSYAWRRYPNLGLLAGFGVFHSLLPSQSSNYHWAEPHLKPASAHVGHRLWFDNKVNWRSRQQTLTLLPHWVNFLVARWYWRCAMHTSPTPSRILFLSSTSRSSISFDGVSFSTSSSVIGMCCSMHSFSASQYCNQSQFRNSRQLSTGVKILALLVKYVNGAETCKQKDFFWKY